MEISYYAQGDKIEVIKPISKTYTLKELQDSEQEFIKRKSMAENSLAKINSELSEIQLLIEKFKELNITE